MQLNRKSEPLTSIVTVDEFTEAASAAFDYEFIGESKFFPYELPELGEYEIGVIVGASGSGKSLLLKELGEISAIPEWEDSKAIISHFESPDEGIEKLSAVGLNSIPSWCKPYSALSNGEQFRANLARQLKDGAIIDEFTSVVDRNVAKAAATSISKYIKRNNLKNVTLATCHYDILQWLEPSWIIDTSVGTLTRGSLRRPTIKLDLYKTDYKSWRLFREHHYLSGEINQASRCYVAVWDNQIVGFQAVIRFPSGTVKNAWRGHRTVILPDFQGLGLGARMSDVIGQTFIEEGCRYFCRTANPRLGEYRQNSPKWKPTSKNKVHRKDIQKKVRNFWKHWRGDGTRVCYSHEYIGLKDS
jgi:GNAT superfamily N-acetyltransferase